MPTSASRRARPRGDATGATVVALDADGVILVRRADARRAGTSATVTSTCRRLRRSRVVPRDDHGSLGRQGWGIPRRDDGRRGAHGAQGARDVPRAGPAEPHVLFAARIRTGRNAAATGTWIFRGDGSRRRRGWDVDVPCRRRGHDSDRPPRLDPRDIHVVATATACPQVRLRPRHGRQDLLLQSPLRRALGLRVEDELGRGDQGRGRRRAASDSFGVARSPRRGDGPRARSVPKGAVAAGGRRGPTSEGPAAAGPAPKRAFRAQVTDYFDSVTGKPLFKAPVGRSFADFEKESRAHGWPSFRDDEVNWDYVRVLPNGEAVSVDGARAASGPIVSGRRRACGGGAAAAPRRRGRTDVGANATVENPQARTSATTSPTARETGTASTSCPSQGGAPSNCSLPVKARVLKPPSRCCSPS